MLVIDSENSGEGGGGNGAEKGWEFQKFEI